MSRKALRYEGWYPCPELRFIERKVLRVRGGGQFSGLELRGQLEGLFTAPRFVAKDPNGKAIAEKSWGEGVSLGHHGALEHLRTFLLGLGNELRLAGAGHRVVHSEVRTARADN